MPTVQLIGKRLRPVRRELLLTGNATAVGPGVALIRSDPDYVADAHAAGKEVHVWTVNSAADMDLVRDLGVDAASPTTPTRCCAARRAAAAALGQAGSRRRSRSASGEIGRVEATR